MNKKGKVSTFVEHTNTYIICLVLINIQKEKGLELEERREDEFHRAMFNLSSLNLR